jgi:hypothetical protein
LAGTVYAGYYDETSITDMASIRGGKENTTLNHFGGILAFYTRPNGGADTERLRIDSSGRVLIGTTAVTASSSEKFEVYNGMSLLDFNSDTVATLYIKNRSTTANTIQPYIYFTDGGGNRGGYGIKTTDSSNHHFAQGGFNFYTGAAGFSNNRVTISSTGNVGIGTTAPAETVDVSGTVKAQKLTGYTYSVSGGNVDTAITAGDFTVLEVFGSANPNSGGSGGYTDPIHFYIYNGRGWNGSALTSYIYTVAIAPSARSMFPSGSSNSANDPIQAVWLTGSTESDSCAANSSLHQVRIKITNFNADFGSNFTLSVIKRF